MKSVIFTEKAYKNANKRLSEGETPEYCEVAMRRELRYWRFTRDEAEETINYWRNTRKEAKK